MPALAKVIEIVLDRVGVQAEAHARRQALRARLAVIMGDISTEFPQELLDLLRDCADRYFPDERAAQEPCEELLLDIVARAARSAAAADTVELLLMVHAAIRTLSRAPASEPEARGADYVVSHLEELTRLHDAWSSERRRVREAYLDSDRGKLLQALADRARGRLRSGHFDERNFGLIWRHERFDEDLVVECVRRLRASLLDALGAKIAVDGGGHGCFQLFFSAVEPVGCPAEKLAVTPEFLAAAYGTRAERLLLFNPQRSFDLRRIVRGPHAMFSGLRADLEAAPGSLRVILEGLPRESSFPGGLPPAHVMPRSSTCKFAPAMKRLDLGQDSVSINFEADGEVGKVRLDLIVDGLSVATLNQPQAW